MFIRLTENGDDAVRSIEIIVSLVLLPLPYVIFILKNNLIIWILRDPLTHRIVTAETNKNTVSGLYKQYWLEYSQ